MRAISNISKKQYYDYLILIFRVILAWTFLRYGWSKLTENQFGITKTELNTPIGELNLFRISWYLFEHQPFKYAIGAAQIICACLLLYKKTVLYGALMFLPIVFTILIIDLTVMDYWMAEAFAYRLTGYIILDILILYHYKGRMLIVIRQLWNDDKQGFHYPLWAYAILPIFAIMVELILAIFKNLIKLLLP